MINKVKVMIYSVTPQQWYKIGMAVVLIIILLGCKSTPPVLPTPIEPPKLKDIKTQKDLIEAYGEGLKFQSHIILYIRSFIHEDYAKEDK